MDDHFEFVRSSDEPDGGLNYWRAPISIDYSGWPVNAFSKIDDQEASAVKINIFI